MADTTQDAPSVRTCERLLDALDDGADLALAEYNAGVKAVVKYGNRIPPYPETQKYARKELQFLYAVTI